MLYRFPFMPHCPAQTAAMEALVVESMAMAKPASRHLDPLRPDEVVIFASLFCVIV
jgi:hypothetical protein